MSEIVSEIILTIDGAARGENNTLACHQSFREGDPDLAASTEEDYDPRIAV